MPPMRLVEKPKDFKGTLKQLASYVRPYYGRIILSLVLMVISTVMCIYGPRLIGNVTTLISEGIVSKYMGGEGIDFNVIGKLGGKSGLSGQRQSPRHRGLKPPLFYRA